MKKLTIDFDALDHLDLVVEPAYGNKKELARDNALTIAAIHAYMAEQALEEAQKNAIETAAHYARLRTLDDFAHTQATPRRSRRATMRRSA